MILSDVCFTNVSPFFSTLTWTRLRFLSELNLGWHALCPSLLAKTFWPGYDVQLRRADSWPQPLLQPPQWFKPQKRSPNSQPTERSRVLIHNPWSNLTLTPIDLWKNPVPCAPRKRQDSRVAWGIAKPLSEEVLGPGIDSPTQQLAWFDCERLEDKNMFHNFIEVFLVLFLRVLWCFEIKLQHFFSTFL